MSKIHKFEDLEIWSLALKITKLIYDITAKKEFVHDYDLKNQIRSAIVSVSSNIVEGFEKNNNNEFKRFLKIAKGSVGEVRNELYICLTVEYVDKKEFEIINNYLLELAAKIGRFIKYLEVQYSQKKFLKK